MFKSSTNVGEYFLPTQLDDISEYLAAYTYEGYYAIDTETTGLNTRACDLVGIAISTKPGTGMYIPIGHQGGQNFQTLHVI